MQFSNTSKKRTILSKFSPGCSENPFPFFFKKEKIATENGNDISEKAPITRSMTGNKFGLKKILSKVYTLKGFLF